MSSQAPPSVTIRGTLLPATIDDLTSNPSRVIGLERKPAPQTPAEFEARQAALQNSQEAVVQAAGARQRGSSSSQLAPPPPLPEQPKVTVPQPPGQPICKPYLSIAELAQLTPWTDQAIRTMISKGILREGKHFFYVGRRPIFKWTAIVAFIERPQPRDPVPHYRDQMTDGAKA